MRSNPEFSRAFRLDRQGRIADAAVAYRRVLASEPHNGDVLHLLGVALAKMGRVQDAVGLIGNAVKMQPRNFVMQTDLGSALSELGRYTEAIACYRQALASKPDLSAAHRGSGIALLHLGRFEQAVWNLEQAVRLAPNDAFAYGDLGVALGRLNRSQEALHCFERAIDLNPNHADAHRNRGLIQAARGLFADALASFDRALALVPNAFDMHFNRGVALNQLERPAESLAAFERALALDGNSFEAFNNRGVALVQLSRPEEAVRSFMRAALCKPDHSESYTNAGNTLKGLKRYREALENFDRALSIKPDDVMTTWSKALTKLTLGEFREGWPLYESRLRLAHLLPLQPRFSAPRWTGAESVAHKIVLVHAEQGLGDTVQFCRYVTLLEARGARVVFEVQPVLRTLLGSLKIHGSLVNQGESLPAFDLVCPLLSLPLAFRTEIDQIPGGVPYLKADEAAARAWKKRLSVIPGLKVGLHWQGNAATEKQPWLRGRSFALSEAAGLAHLPEVSLVSLQKGEGSEQRETVPFKSRIAQLTDPRAMGPEEFADTAALVTALDLVITSDTAIAHVAGALGVPVWVILPFESDWRWMSAREDSPWYPTMRLFRQRSAGDWAEVFKRVADELRALAVSQRHRSLPAPAHHHKSPLCHKLM
jgi:tetratricopeptide (TPR) repeat protein